MSVFETLNAVNVNGHTEKKNGLTYLSWAWAWAEVKKLYPDANYTVYERPDGVIYWTDGRTCWVKTGLTINGIEHIEYLPVMDFRNNSIPADKVTSMDVNKAIQRSLTKAAARHGLGLYIYAGEDLPEGETEPEKPAPKPAAKQEPAPQPKPDAVNRKAVITATCERLGITTASFGEFKRLAVKNRIIPDKLVNALTDEEFGILLNFVEANADARVS